MIKPIERVYQIIASYYFFNPLKSDIQNKLLNTRIKIAGLSFQEHLRFYFKWRLRFQVMLRRLF